jgi:signal transduction histidine kinase
MAGRPLAPDANPFAWSAASGEQVISHDLATEMRWDPWRSVALSHGIRASWSTPIRYSCGDVSGVFSALFRDTRGMDPGHHALIAQFTHLASIAIERAHGEAALRQSQAFMSKAQRLSMTGTFSWRVGSDEIVWSDEVYRILELDPAVTPTFELIDTRIHPEDLPAHDEMIRRQRNSPGDFEHEHRLLFPDGRVKWVHLVAHATRTEDGGVEYIAGLQDITQRRLSEEALGKVRSELAHVARVASLGALTASIAHEVNQPLAGIITNASTCLRMLGAEPPNIDGARETARRTIRDGNRASDVIKRLRALFAKKDATTEPLDLNEAAREVMAMLLGELQRNGVVFHPDFADDLPLVRGDRVQLQQVILNLVLNASDAMSSIRSRPRHLRISTGVQEDGHVRLAVQDSGVGIDPVDPERMFNAFYTTKSSGMGIGLSVSRSIIESHDGRLWALANEGPGATFHFSLPCAPTACEPMDDAGAGSDNLTERL